MRGHAGREGTKENKGNKTWRIIIPDHLKGCNGDEEQVRVYWMIFNNGACQSADAFCIYEFYF